MTRLLKLKKEISNIQLLICVLMSISTYLFIEKKQLYFLLGSAILFMLLENKKYSIAAIFLASIIYLHQSLTRSSAMEGSINGEYKIIDFIFDKPVIKQNGHKIFINIKISGATINDLIYVDGKIQIPTNTSDFNFVGYLENNNIYSMISKGNIKFISEENNFREEILGFIYSGDDAYSKVVPLLLLGKTGSDPQIYQSAIDLNIVHLFVVSGFHISMLYFAIWKIFKFLGLNKEHAKLLSFVPIIFYVYLLDFSIPSLRASLFIFFLLMNKIFRERFSKMQIFAILLFIMAVVFPRQITSLSFILTFNASFFVVYFSQKEYTSKTKKWIIFSAALYLSNLPIIISINDNFSVLGFLAVLGFSPVFSFYFLATTFLFPFRDLLNIIYTPFIYSINLIHSINITLPINIINDNILKATYLLTLSSIIIIMKWNLYMELNRIE